jgi:4-hydroxybenzoyl-CoA reductase subunit beta
MLRLPEFEYHRPRTLEEAIGLLDRLGPAAMPIAGGTDLVPNLKHRLHEPRHLVALRGIDGLRGIEAAGGELAMGACATLAEVAADPAVRQHAPALARAAGSVAGPQLRNMGTIGGNLCLDTRCTYYNQTYFWRQALGFCLKKDGDTCHVTQVGRKCVAAHSADTPPVLWAMGAVVDLVSGAGERSVPVDEFFVADGIANTVRRPGELVTRIRVPVPAAATTAAFVKLRPRGSIDFPILNVAAVAELEPDARVRRLRLVVSALGARPREVTGLEELAGRLLDDDAIRLAADRARQQCRPLTNVTVDPEWRREMVPVQVRRALAELREAPAAATPA